MNGITSAIPKFSTIATMSGVEYLRIPRKYVNGMRNPQTAKANHEIHAKCIPAGYSRSDAEVTETVDMANSQA